MKIASNSKIVADTGILILGAALLVLLASSVAAFFYVGTNSAFDKEYISLAGEQRVLSQSIVKNATESASANVTAFKLLRQSRDQFENNLNLLRDGNKETGTPASPSDVQSQLQSVTTLWDDFGKNADSVLRAEGTIRMLSEFVGAINETMPNLLALSDEVVSLMIESGANASQIYIASRQLMLVPRISVNANKVLQGGVGSSAAAERFGRDAALFGRVLTGMIKGDRKMNVRRVRDPDARDKLAEVSEQFETVHELVGRILEQTPSLFGAQKASTSMAKQSEALLTITTDLRNAYTQLSSTRIITTTTGNLLGGSALLILILLGYKIQTDTRKRLAETAEQNKQNQDAIMRLLDEIGDLAIGDLTTTATVTENITGAIADAINYTIDQLRRLVSTINETTVQVSSAAQETQATAMHLAEASDHQAEQITAASAAVNEMAISIDTVSSNATESSAVATRSMEIAKKGTGAVQNTIRGMDTIREQIQETSKRIKRLGESSQEIGDMVELINDIADQTNILALNAAIQAAMAGESGRGFAVVADEVQRLAEKSTDATRQIEALVKTIQSDTNEAVASMEISTTQVVEGAKLAQNAGEALEEIETVSIHLADLTTSISDSAQQQAAAASSISESMNVIQEVTTQTSAGTNETSASIGNLADLSNELRKSVAGFKLPD
ncbi:MAG: type IV pili methyl-accepting chemotaxis transducer N-terminal domain-containing protein [Ectothiorhodospiraceae bacterium]|nr:type IV pili methyl-accepting chemotaxis transducer N-terminal domain-containing protein [Ectothiorhodospiraceae bacterium]